MDVEATLVLRPRKPAPRARGSDGFTVYYVFGGARKVGCTVRLDKRLAEQGIPADAVRVLETIPKSMGVKHAAERERWWQDLLGCQRDTDYQSMVMRRRKRRR
jgi:hypothetical protein